MKLRIIIPIIVVVAIGAVTAGFILKSISNKNTNPPSKSGTTEVKDPYLVPDGPCQPKQLQADISTQGAAGSIYAKLELTNISKIPCQVTLGNSISSKVDATNVTIQYKQKNTPEKFMLAPSAKAYSQVHFPNGPQCSSGVTPKDIIFYYDLGTPFNTKDQTQIKIQACTSTSEQTVVDIWPLSKNPITK